MQNIPTSIQSAPVIEAIIELRFNNTSLPSEAIFANLFSHLSSEFPATEQLPTLAIPKEIRDQQEQFKYTADYRLSNGSFTVSIGHNVLSVGHLALKTPYTSWETYKAVFDTVFAAFNKLSLASDFTRLEVKYINALKTNLTEALELNANSKNADIVSAKNVMITYDQELDGENQLSTLIASNAKIEGGDYSHEGAALNIAASTVSSVKVEDVSVKVNVLHSEVEKEFFSLLKESYLEELKPEYD